VNRQLLNLNREGLFVTVLYGVLDGATGKFTYARAGHELPLFCSASGELTIPELRPGRILGLFDDPLITEDTMNLAQGSTLLLYTDGVIEAFDSHAEMFGEERLGQAVCANRTASAQAVCDRVLESVAAHCGVLAQHDDVTVVSVQAKGQRVADLT
jgi:sigma-B regulation protein RsbU (phosphoserine phosphatase)